MSKNGFQICNLCMSADSPTKEISDLGLQDIILFVCGIHVETNDVICQECEIQLYLFRKFKTTAQECYRSLQNSHCNTSVDPNIDLSSDSKVHHLLEIQLLDPSDNQLQTPTKQDEEVSQLVPVPESSNPSHMPSKTKRKRDPLSLKKDHRQTKKECTTKASLRVEPRSIFTGHECQICDKIFVTKKRLTKHALEQHTNTIWLAKNL